MKNEMMKKTMYSVACAVIIGLSVNALVYGSNAHAAQKAVAAEQEQAELTQDPENNGGNETGEDAENTDHTEKNKDTKTEKLKKPVLIAASKPDGVIKLKWRKVSGAQTYVLMRSTQKDSGFSRIYQTSTGEASYEDKGREQGQPYYYRLIVYSKGKKSSAQSRTVKGRSFQQPQVTQISNVSGSRRLVLNWKPVKGAEIYQVLRKSTDHAQYEVAGTVKGQKTTFTDKNCSGGTVYTYKVCAKDRNGGKGTYSEAASQMAIDADRKMIALTYDDGPSEHTPIVLKALKKYDAHATFFVVGNRVSQFADSLKQEAALGCEIGNHTYAHNSLGKLSAAQVQSVIAKTNQIVKRYAGVDIHILRPPGGGYTSATLQAAGMPAVLWSVDTMDWKTRDTAATIRCVQQKAYDGSIVLMHDLHAQTAYAADAVMKYLKEQGYQMVTVSEMAAYRGGMQNIGAYSQFL